MIKNNEYIKNKSINKAFFYNKLWKNIITIFAFLIIFITFTIGAFLIFKGSEVFTRFHHNAFEFLFSSNWSPADNSKGGGHIGAAIFIFGSISTCFLAILVATPISIAIAILASEISPKIGTEIIQPAIELFVGIPSIVFGWVGLTVLVPFIKNLFHLPTGYSVLAASIVLCVMIMPTITSIAIDSLKSIPDDYRFAAYALGATRWQVIYQVVFPAAKANIITGVILGLSRAFGEALAVAMVIGKKKAFPSSLLSPTTNLTSAIASDMGGAMEGGEYNLALWAMALLLFVISLIFIMLIHSVTKRGERI